MEEIKHEPVAYSPSVNVIRPILAKHMNEWSNEMLCELVNEIDLAVSKEREKILEVLTIDVNPSNEDQRIWYRGLGREEAQREMRDKVINLINHE